MAELVDSVRQLGLSHVHLALGRLIFLDDKQKHMELGHLRASGLTFTVTGRLYVLPDLGEGMCHRQQLDADSEYRYFGRQ